MFVRRKNHRVWVDSDFDAQHSARQHKPLQTHQQRGRYGQSRVIQAQRPIAGKLGRCLSIRLREAELEVLVAHPDRVTRWYPAAQALTEGQAEAWAKFGFGR